jgi:hypothetical protein
MDRFPEAFDRFERRVDTSSLESASELIRSFAYFASFRYTGTKKQLDAIRLESEKRGYSFDWSLPLWVKKRDYKRFYSRGYDRRAHVVYGKRETWRHETVLVKGKPQTRYRDLKTGRFTKKPMSAPFFGHH